MKKFNIVILLVFISLIGIEAFPQQFWVAPGGSDLNPGTREKPLASLQAARDKAREMRKSGIAGALEIVALPGDYVMIQPLELTSEDSGTPGSPLVFRSEGGKAVFRGGISVTGFVKENDNLWKAFIPGVAWNNYYFEQLWVNGKRAVRARTPDKGFFMVKGVTETVIEKGSGRSPEFAVQKIMLDSTDSGCFRNFSDQDYRDALVVFYHNWDNTRKRVMNYTRKESAIYTAGGGMKTWNPINQKSRWFAENFIGALNAPGEWFLDRSGYLYYIPLPGEKIETSTFFMPVLSKLITIRGDKSEGRKVSHIRFHNLAFEVAGYSTPSDGNEPAQAAAPVDAVITLENAENIEFNGCDVAHTGTYAFWFRNGCSNCKLEKSYLHDLGAGGIKIGEPVMPRSEAELTNNITVDNNIIRDAGHVFPCAVGVILFHASDNRITHNEIADLRYTGISAGWVWGYAHSPSKRNMIEFNHIHHLGWGELCDMGGVYTLGASEGTTVSNNVIHHVYSYDYGGWGLYTDEGSFGITEENNLVYACKNSGFHQHYGKENTIRNNIFAFNIRSQLQATRIEEHRSITFTNNIILFDKGTLLSSNWHKFKLFADNNCYWDTRTTDIKFATQTFDEWKKTGKDEHSVIADPFFVNPYESDYRFRKLTTAKKIGFKPFDYSRAGVYGDEEWKRLALFDPALAERFDNVVKSMEEKKLPR